MDNLPIEMLWEILSYLYVDDFINARQSSRRLYRAATNDTLFRTVIANTIQLEKEVQDRVMYVASVTSKDIKPPDCKPFSDVARDSGLDPVLFYTACNLQTRLQNPQVVSYKCFNEGSWVHMLHYTAAPKFCVSCGSSKIDRYRTNYRPAPDWYPDARRYLEAARNAKK